MAFGIRVDWGLIASRIIFMISPLLLEYLVKMWRMLMPMSFEI